MTFLYARDGDSLRFFLNFNDPADGQPFSNIEVTAVAFRVLDPSTTPATVLLATTAGTWDATLLQWKLAWTFGAALDGVRVIAIEAIPTRTATVSPALWPEVRKLVDVADITKRQDEIEAKVDAVDAVADAIRATDVPAIQQNVDDEGTATRSLVQTETDAIDAAVADVDADLAAHEANRASMESTLVAEHDATQSQLAAIATGESTMLVAPLVLSVPFSGTNSYRVELVVVDDDTGALVDADSLPTLTARDETGAAPTGLTVGAFTNTATGRYQADLTVASTAPDFGQVFFEANFTEGGEARVRIRSSHFQAEGVEGGGHLQIVDGAAP